MLVKQVINLHIFALKSRGDGVIVECVRPSRNQLFNFVVHLVGLATIVLAEIHIDLIELNAKLSEILSANRLLQKIDIIQGIADLSGEAIIPIGIPVHVISGELRSSLVKVLIKFKFVEVAIRWRKVKRIVVHVGDRQAMRIVDVPVGFQQIFFVFEIKCLRRSTSGLIAIDFSGNSRNLI